MKKPSAAGKVWYGTRLGWPDPMRCGTTPEAHTLQSAGPKALDDDVGIPRQGQHNVDRLWRFQVQAQTALVAVKGEELRALPVPEGRPGTGLISPFRLLDLNDVGAHISQHHGAEGASQGAGQVHHFDIL